MTERHLEGFEHELFLAGQEETPDLATREAAIYRIRERARSGQGEAEPAISNGKSAAVVSHSGRNATIAALGLAMAACLALYLTKRGTNLPRLPAEPEPPFVVIRRPAGVPASTRCDPAVCATVKPKNSLIVDFTDVGPNGLFVDNDHFSSPDPDWSLQFYGTPYVYPESKPASGDPALRLLSQTTAQSWHVFGNVRDWSGFGLWLGACTVDMSAYKGIEFDIGGHVGASGHVTLFASTGPDSPPETCRTNVGRCDVKSGLCESPRFRLAVPAAMTKIRVLWRDFTEGRPRATPDPREIISFRWAFDWDDWAGKKSDPYPVDVNIDSIRLIE